MQHGCSVFTFPVSLFGLSAPLAFRVTTSAALITAILFVGAVVMRDLEFRNNLEDLEAQQNATVAWDAALEALVQTLDPEQNDLLYDVLSPLVVDDCFPFPNSTIIRESPDFPNLDLPEPEAVFDFAGSLWFCFTVVTTIGYGTYAPQTSQGQAFTVVYAYLFIPMAIFFISQLGDLLRNILEFIMSSFIIVYRLAVYVGSCTAKQIARSVTTARPVSANRSSRSSVMAAGESRVNSTASDVEEGAAGGANRVDTDVAGGEVALAAAAAQGVALKGIDWEVSQVVQRRDDRGYATNLAIWVTLYMVITAGYAAATVATEGWSYGLAFYSASITFTTVGLGDVVISTDSLSKTVSYIAFIFLGLASLAGAISTAADWIGHDKDTRTQGMEKFLRRKRRMVRRRERAKRAKRLGEQARQEGESEGGQEGSGAGPVDPADPSQAPPEVAMLKIKDSDLTLREKSGLVMRRVMCGDVYGKPIREGRPVDMDGSSGTDDTASSGASDLSENEAGVPARANRRRYKRCARCMRSTAKDGVCLCCY